MNIKDNAMNKGGQIVLGMSDVEIERTRNNN